MRWYNTKLSRSRVGTTTILAIRIVCRTRSESRAARSRTLWTTLPLHTPLSILWSSLPFPPVLVNYYVLGFQRVSTVYTTLDNFFSLLHISRDFQRSFPLSRPISPYSDISPEIEIHVIFVYRKSGIINTWRDRVIFSKAEGSYNLYAHIVYSYVIIIIDMDCN